MPVFDADLIAQIVNIIVIDLVLSGDNAVVIGMAASQLVGRDRRQAILWGVIGAIGLRVIFTALISVLLDVPLLQVGGGVMLVWIAYKLVRPAKSHNQGDIRAASTRVDAIRTIVMADVVMSLDNILAVGGAAHGDITLLLFGLALSMPLITFGSGFVAWALDRLPILIFLGAAVLAKVAGEMIGHDPFVVQTLAGVIGDGGVHTMIAAIPPLAWWPGANETTILTLILEGGLTFVVVALGIVMRLGRSRGESLAAQAHEEAVGALAVHLEVTDVVEDVVEDVAEAGHDMLERVDAATRNAVTDEVAADDGDTAAKAKKPG